MKYSRQAIALTVASFLIGLAACDGGHQGPSPLSPIPAAPVVSLSDATARIVLRPKTLSFTSTGTAKTVTVKDKGYKGKIVAAAGACKGIASISPASGKGPAYKVTITSQGAGKCSILFKDKKKKKATLSIDVTTTGPTSTPSTKPSTSPSTKPTTSSSPTLGPVVATPASVTICPSSGTAKCGSDSQPVALSQVNYSGTFGHTSHCAGTVATVAGSGSSFTVTGASTAGTCSATFVGGGGKFATLPITVVGAVVASPDPAKVCPSSSSTCDVINVTISEPNYTGNFTELDTCSGKATVTQLTDNTYRIAGGPTSGTSCTATFTGALGEQYVLGIEINTGIIIH